MNRKIYTLLAVILLFGIIGFISLRGFSFILLLIPIMSLFAGLFGWMLPAVVKRVNSKVWIAMGLLILLGLIFPTSLLFADRETGPVSSLIGTTLYLLPSFALVTSAVLLSTGLPEISSSMGNNRIAVFSRILCALLVLKAFYNLYELTLWDNTDDGLGYLWMFVPIFVAFFSGVLLFVLLPNRTKLAVFAYILFIPVLLVAVSDLAQRVDFHQETEKRAERTVRAIESFYAREGRYPGTLSELMPRYILSVPEPMIIYGQDWCYESSEDYYRLGYIDREHWSDPRLIGRLYSGAGEAPGSRQICLEQFATIKSKNPDFPYSYREESQ
jgi:hypothetical protein